MHVPRNPQYNMHICDMGGKGGVGWGNNVHVKWHKHGMYVAQSGWGLVGWGGAITFMSTWTRMDWDLLLHFHTHVMLRSGIFFCTCTHTSCYALRSSFALAHARHATLWDLLLHLRTHVMLRSGIFFCTCTHMSCYALGSSLALSHARHATLWDLLLHLHAHTSFYALGSSLALSHARHATFWLSQWNINDIIDTCMQLHEISSPDAEI